MKKIFKGEFTIIAEKDAIEHIMETDRDAETTVVNGERIVRPQVLFVPSNNELIVVHPSNEPMVWVDTSHVQPSSTLRSITRSVSLRLSTERDAIEKELHAFMHDFNIAVLHVTLKHAGRNIIVTGGLTEREDFISVCTMP